jgi:hypothetical protein
LVWPAEARADDKRFRHACGGEHVTIGIGVPAKIDLLEHRDDANNRGVPTCRALVVF